MKRIILYCAAALLPVLPGTAGADKAASFNRKGIEAYKSQQYEESFRQFTEAAVERPETPEIIFNRGTSLSALGKKDEAVSTLLQSSQGLKEPNRAAAAHFNAGNTLYAAGDYQGALEQYRRAVKLDQGSEDIRHNLELALRKISDQQRQSDQDNKQKSDQEQDKQKQKNPDQNQQNQQQKQDQQSKQQNSDVRPMTKEEAERLLNAINDEERKSLSLRNQKAKGGVPQGNDW